MEYLQQIKMCQYYFIKIKFKIMHDGNGCKQYYLQCLNTINYKIRIQNKYIQTLAKIIIWLFIILIEL